MRRFQGQQLAFIVVTDGEFGQERMTLAGQHHVLIAIEAHPGRSSCHLGGQSGQRRRSGGLRFLAAESAAHARDRNDHLVGRNPEHMGNTVLHLGRVLRGTGDVHRAVFARLGIGRLHLEVKMLLPAEGKITLHDMRRIG